MQGHVLKHAQINLGALCPHLLFVSDVLVGRQVLMPWRLAGSCLGKAVSGEKKTGRIILSKRETRHPKMQLFRLTHPTMTVSFQSNMLWVTGMISNSFKIQDPLGSGLPSCCN